MKIVIIIPTYNEVENIKRLIEALESVRRTFPQHETELLVVDDNSPDGTGDVVRELMKRWKNLHLLSGEKRGLGQAYLRGMDHAVKNLKAEVIFEIDADYQHDPAAIPKFIEKIDAGYDFVIGSRYIPGGSIPQNWGRRRKLLSRVGNLLVRLFLVSFAIRDWTSGYRAIRSWVYEKAQSQLRLFNGYTFQVAFLHIAMREGATIVEIPIHFGERQYGKSKIGGEYVRNLLIYLMNVRLRETAASRFIKFAIVGGTGFVLQTVIFELLGVIYNMVTPAVATVIGGQIAIISNYVLNNIWTFKDKIITDPVKLLGKFLQFWLTSNFAVIVLQGGTVKLGEDVVGKDSILIQGFYLLGIILTLIWNYTIYNRLIWKTHESPDHA